MEPNQSHHHIIERTAIRATRWIGSPTSLVVHTALFTASFILILFGVPTDKVLLVLTTLVSLEAIYLSIFIQMSVNRNTRRLHEVSKDINEIQDDIEHIEEDVKEISEDVDEIQKDVDEIQEDVEEITEDVEEIQKDVDEIQEDVEGIHDDMNEEVLPDESVHTKTSLQRIESLVQQLEQELSTLKKDGNKL